VDVTKLIVKSCNLGAATIGFKLGAQRLRRYVRRFGFGSKTNLGISGESTGAVPPAGKWADITLANVAFGQSVSVTPPQLLAAYSAIANDGVRPRPHLLKRIEAGAGKPEQEIVLPGSRVISAQTAAAMCKMLCGVVDEGTGKAAQIEGYRVAGKTGTAQKALPGRGFTAGKFVGSFIGFVPADNPKLAILVVIDEPTAGHFGAVVAAPAWCEVAKRSLAYLGIPPTQVAKALQAGI
jgi:cell division protein FtsI (penicillin-binding protein 3)